MTLLICKRCTTKFSVGAPWCPGCTSTDYVEEGQEMPKNTVLGGSSHAGEPVEAVEEAPVVEAAPEVVDVTAADEGSADEDTPDADSEPEPEAEAAPVKRGRGKALAAGEDA